MNAKLSLVKDPIEVYCRIRPLEHARDPVCLKAGNKNTVILFSPENTPSSRGKEVHYTFKEVFDTDTSQKQLFDKTSLPLVEDVLLGSNGLIFTYGITSSGKTYTMTGSPQNGGLLPRALDVIFNSIKECQAEKFVFKPDKLNEFEAQSTSEAKMDQQREIRLLNRTSMKTPRREKTVTERVPDSTVVAQLPADVNYAIFVSYVEIYNNYIYDLLEDTPTDLKKKMNVNSKILRKDASQNMYVFGITESEVKTVEEALDLFYKGQLRRRVSNTVLNLESSRSHSIFTIRVVQAPLDPQGADLLLDKELITVSQLSLVDLAGSERCVRTKNTGQKLREAGNINASLMTLRNCIEILRESQTLGITKKIPYRESKLTHLFKSFFEGQGKVRMIVCVNPQAEYFDETVHVMKFAEMTQDVVIPRSVSTPLQVGLTPGRGKLYREAVRKAKEEGVSVTEILAPTVYTLGPPFPDLNDNFSDDSDYLNLIDFLVNRQSRRTILINDLMRKYGDFRKCLSSADNEIAKLKQEKATLKMDLDGRNHQLESLENKMVAAQQDNLILEKQLSECQEELENTKSQLQNTTQLLSEQKKEVEKCKFKMQERIALEKDRMRRVMEKRLAEKQAELECKMCITDERFRQLREILNADDWDFIGDVPQQPVSESNTLAQAPLPSILKMSKSKSTTLEVPPSEIRFMKTRSNSNFRNMEPSIRDAAKVFEKENRPPSFPFQKRTVSESHDSPSKIMKTG